VLITPVDDSPGSRLEQLILRGTPVVLVDRGSGRASRCSVAVDDVLGGRLAGRHLRERRHRRIAFVGGPFSIQQVADRYAGLTEALAGAPAPSIVPTPNLTIASGRTAAGRLADLPDADRPTAVFCANDLLALGVLQELTQRGLRVPRDVAIVGYDDIEFAAAAAVPLSSVRQPREQLGRAAAELLLEEVNAPEQHEHRQVLFQPSLVVRASSLPDRRVAGQPLRPVVAMPLTMCRWAIAKSTIIGMVAMTLAARTISHSCSPAWPNRSTITFRPLGTVNRLLSCR
jgi:DNA-binding LacI/PurR family transcriptional regulator